jgi:hypothetical protein
VAARAFKSDTFSELLVSVSKCVVTFVTSDYMGCAAAPCKHICRS